MRMSPTLHRQFVDISGEFSSELSDDIKAAGPVEIPNRRGRSLAEFLSRVIVGQQLSTKAARTIWSRVQAASRQADVRIPEFFRDEYAPLLRQCGVSGNKAKALFAIRDAIASGRLDTRKLRRMSSNERRDVLIELRGIGQWTVDMTSIFYFNETDVWPNGDLAVVKVFDRYLNGRQRKNPHRYAERFQPHRSFLAYYMWHLADGVPTR